jgi:UDP-glucuronate 4-epimerase
MTKILVTGAAGFIGMGCASRLLARGNEVVGIDNFSDYYDVKLKNDRLALLKKFSNFSFYNADCSDLQKITNVFQNEQPSRVIHLAAQPGVRYSLENPRAYIESNIYGFLNVLECCKYGDIEHLVYASSSSVYGWCKEGPFEESAYADRPVSLYAASKKSNELMAHAYSHIYKTPTTGLRFFTVYGPWGRPDMAPFLFAKAMLRGEKIDIFNNGDMVRDFTYIDDIVEGVVNVLNNAPIPARDEDPSDHQYMTDITPHRIFNIGNGKPIKLLDFIVQLEKAFGVKAEKNFLPMQPGDVPSTFADTKKLKHAVDFTPSTSISIGIEKYAEWFFEYYGR